MKQKAFVFGAGSTARNLLSDIRQTYDVIGFLDNDPKRWTNTNGGGGGAVKAKINKPRPRLKIKITTP
ncbi:MAG: hypothetical protein LBI57_06755 [Helicobacteraceae bacterium]|jgi:FlaA1/EpsC-like NDP-sugar epimerase|nr:hypothetical protein [Helicobacteraceae bacterium]